VRKFVWILVPIVILAATAWWWVKSTREPDVLVLSTGAPNGTYYPLGQAIADAVTSTTQLRIRVLESAGSRQNRERLLATTADLAFLQNDAEPHPQIRCLVPMHFELFHFFVAPSSDIDHFRQLIGKRVALGPPESGTRRVALQLMEHYAVDIEQLTVVDASPEAAIQLMKQGELDALFHVGNIESGLSRELLLGDAARLVSFGVDQEWNNDVQALEVSYPYFEAATIPRSLYVTKEGKGKPARPVHTFGLRSMLVCRKDLPDEVAHRIVQAIIQQRSAIMRKCHAAREVGEQFDRSQLHFPLHSGARNYYERGEPGFLERHAETMALLLSLLAAGWGLAVAGSRAMTMHKKNRIDRYYVRLNQISEQLAQPDLTVASIDELDIELNQLRTQAIGELTRERLKADDSFRIFQSLLTDCQHQASVRRSQQARLTQRE